MLPVLERVLAALSASKPARTVGVKDAAERRQLDLLQPLTAKPALYVCNVDEASAATGNALSAKVEAMAAERGAPCVTISARIESEISMLGGDDEKRAFLDVLGVAETGLTRIVKAGYRLLDLITYITVGPKETRAWTIPAGTAAPQAAGVIHTDFERTFIRAETISYDDYISCGGEQGAKKAGKMRVEGKDYVVRDGDIMHFRVGA